MTVIPLVLVLHRGTTVTAFSFPVRHWCFILKTMQETEGSLTRPERRGSTRFPIETAVRYRRRYRKQVSEGQGVTVNISSSGVLFTTSQPLTPGLRVKLAISWPVQLDGRHALKLVVDARVVRCLHDRAAVEIERYGFHTQGSNGLRLMSESSTL